MTRRGWKLMRPLGGLLFAGVGGAWAWSCVAGVKAPGDSDAPLTTTPAPTPTTLGSCEDGWLTSDLSQATYVLRGGEDDSELGYTVEEGDLDQDGRADLFIGGLGGEWVYVVLGASLFAHPPGEYPIAEVADYVLSLKAVGFGEQSFAEVGGALYVSPLGEYAGPTFRVPYAALVAAGGGPHPVEALADATFTGTDRAIHRLLPCDVDADGAGDIVMGSYAIPGIQNLAGAVDLDAAGLLINAGPARAWGPCADLDGDGRDDLTAIVLEYEGETVNNALDVWYGPVTSRRAGTTLPLGGPDVVLRVGAKEPGHGSSMYVTPDAVGDWDGDGNPDLAITVNSLLPDGWTDVLLFLGEPGFRPTGTILGRTDAEFTVTEISTIRSLGKPTSLAGDLNGDGRDDLVLTDHLGGPDETYARYCPLAPGEYSPAEFAQVTWAAADGNDVELISELLTRGDLDGDGTADVVIGAPWSTTFSHKGAVLVLAK